jgi:hypothetical protein
MRPFNRKNWLTHRGTRSMLALAAILTLWLVTRPYAGIRHDSQLYTAQALRHIQPDSFAHDLFFLYGSQDDYTLFSPLYAQAIRWLGIDQGALILTLSGQALWLTGAFLLARRLLPTPLHWLGLGLAIVLNDYYGYYIFAYGESFLTPRIYAEGLAMMNMSLLVGGCIWIAAGLLVVALLLHPLNALMGGLVAVFWLFHRCPRAMVGVTLTGLLLIGVLAFVGIPPANGLLLTMSDTWYAISDGRSMHLFLHNWDSGNWSRVALTLALLLSTWRLADDPLRTVSRAASFAIICGLGLAWLGGEIWHNVLLIQLQTWRVLWLGMVLAAFSAAWLSWHLWFVQRDWMPIMGFLSAWLLRDSTGGLVALLTMAYCLLPAVRSSRLAKWVPVLIVGMFLVAVVNLVAGNLLFSPNDLMDSSNRLWQTPLSWLALGLGLVTLGQVLIWRAVGTFQVAAAMSAVTGLVLAIGVWDHRTIATQWTDRNPAERARLQAMIPTTAVVYWAGSLPHTWFFLQRSNYISGLQLAGAIFHESTAIEGQHRSFALRPLGVDDSLVTLSGYQISALGDLPRPTHAGLAQVCADPALDWLVLREEFPGAATRYVEFGANWFLYRCVDYRK